MGRKRNSRHECVCVFIVKIILPNSYVEISIFILNKKIKNKTEPKRKSNKAFPPLATQTTAATLLLPSNFVVKLTPPVSSVRCILYSGLVVLPRTCLKTTVDC